jgi:hypothetical protein
VLACASKYELGVSPLHSNCSNWVVDGMIGGSLGDLKADAADVVSLL